MKSADSSHRDPAPGDYVPESRFGEWFQRTDIWRRYVVEPAAMELASLLPRGLGPFTTVLDAGCGEGVAFDVLRRVFGARNLVGVDIHPGSVETARQLAARMGEGVRVHQADATRLPMGSGTIDVVFCHQLLHHCSDPVGVLKELRRVLVPEGWLLVSESCRPFLEWWPVRLLFRHPPREQCTAGEYAALLKESGFSDEATRIMTPAPWWSLPDLGVRKRLGGASVAREATQVRIAAQYVDAGFAGERSRGLSDLGVSRLPA